MTQDVRRADGSPIHDLAPLDAAPEIEWEFLRDGDAGRVPRYLVNPEALEHPR